MRKAFIRSEAKLSLPKRRHNPSRMKISSSLKSSRKFFPFKERLNMIICFLGILKEEKLEDTFSYTLLFPMTTKNYISFFKKKKFGPELWNIQRKILFKFILVIIEKHKKKNLQNYIENVSRFKADSNIPINYIRIELKLSFFEEGLINNILLVFFNQILSDPCHQIFVYFLIDFDETLLCPQLSRKS